MKNSFRRSFLLILAFGSLLCFADQSSSQQSSSVSSSQEDGNLDTNTDLPASNSSEEQFPGDLNEDKTSNEEVTTPNVALKPDISGALDIGQGLLVPLVPIIDPTKNATNSSNTLLSNLPVAVAPVNNENLPDKSNDKQIKRKKREDDGGDDDDLETADDIIFRPLFRYRQEAARRRVAVRKGYYQPYVFAYPNPQYRYYGR